MFNLFKQNPKPEKFEVDSSIRIVESMDIDRKEDLEKFKRWMQGVAAEKSELPSKEELDELHDEATKDRGSGLGILGAIAAIGAGGIGFAAIGGFDGIQQMVSSAMSFLTGGGLKSITNIGNNVFGLTGTEVESLTPALPDLSGVASAAAPLPTPPAATPITPFNEPMVSGQPYNPNSSPRKSSTPPPDPAPPAPAVPSQASLPPLPPTGTGSYASAQQYGADRDDNGDGIPDRKHAGQDFDAGPNDTFFSRIGGEVTLAYGGGGGGYGNYVDIFNEQLGVTERIAEGDRNLVKVGDVIPAGTPVQRGTSQTGVFHYEIRDGRKETYGFAGTRDPVAFLNGLASQPAQPVQPGATPPAAPRPENNSQQQQQQQPNIFDSMIQSFQNLIAPYTGNIQQVFDAFAYMSNKELMDNTILYRDVLTGDVELPTQDAEQYDIQELLDTVPPDMNVSMLSPAAEQALNGGGMIILNNQGMNQGGGGSPTRIMPIPTGADGAPPEVLILTASDPQDLHKKQMYRKLGAK